MEKKEIIDLFFEVVERLIFPTENKVGEKNPASVYTLMFVKEVLMVIKTKETFNLFTNDWVRISSRLKKIIDYPNSFFNEELELIYGQIDEVYLSKEKDVTDFHDDDSSLDKIVNENLLFVLQKGLNLQRGWNQNKINDSNEFFSENYFTKIKKVILAGTRKNQLGFCEANPNIEPCLKFILQTSESFRLNSNRKKFLPLWNDLREYLFSYFIPEGRSNLFQPEWTDLIYEINLLTQKEINSINLDKNIGFYNFYNREFNFFYDKMITTKKNWLKK